eukprot:comp20572_c0_seq1/m.41750 comp20572_c0_seq1/g.41750  ORF comp20572_c0_seq1/g.41750 comp20572_c0_seq1/m.41750 type:complete len:326 (-) comp20572_c0_seq1:472-1449(-)
MALARFSASRAFFTSSIAARRNTSSSVREFKMPALSVRSIFVSAFSLASEARRRRISDRLPPPPPGAAAPLPPPRAAPVVVAYAPGLGPALLSAGSAGSTEVSPEPPRSLRRLRRVFLLPLTIASGAPAPAPAPAAAAEAAPAWSSARISGLMSPMISLRKLGSLNIVRKRSISRREATSWRCSWPMVSFCVRYSFCSFVFFFISASFFMLRRTACSLIQSSLRSRVAVFSRFSISAPSDFARIASSSRCIAASFVRAMCSTSSLCLLTMASERSATLLMPFWISSTVSLSFSIGPSEGPLLITMRSICVLRVSTFERSRVSRRR